MDLLLPWCGYMVINKPEYSKTKDCKTCNQLFTSIMYCPLMLLFFLYPFAARGGIDIGTMVGVVVALVVVIIIMGVVIGVLVARNRCNKLSAPQHAV